MNEKDVHIEYTGLCTIDLKNLAEENREVGVKMMCLKHSFLLRDVIEGEAKERDAARKALFLIKFIANGIQAQLEKAFSRQKKTEEMELALLEQSGRVLWSKEQISALKSANQYYREWGEEWQRAQSYFYNLAEMIKEGIAPGGAEDEQDEFVVNLESDVRELHALCLSIANKCKNLVSAQDSRKQFYERMSS